jgi:hypothetical protein
VAGWRKVHNEELHNLYASLNNIRVMKSRRMRWKGHTVHMGETEKCIQDFGQKTCRKETACKT